MVNKSIKMSNGDIHDSVVRAFKFIGIVGGQIHDFYSEILFRIYNISKYYEFLKCTQQALLFDTK